MKYDFVIDMSVNSSSTNILKRITPGSKVLELGTATGYMTKYMHEVLGCTVYGVEVDKEAADIAKKHCALMIVADIENDDWISELSGEKFDHIIFADVLEHLRNPQRTLKNALGFLKENGTVLISVPNITHNAVIMDLLQDKFEYRELGILDNTHIHFFTQRSLLELTDNVGLNTVEILPLEVHPEDTEFKQRYINFSEGVSSFLINRINAHAYQYLAVCKLKNEKDNLRPILNKSVIESNTFLQIFVEKKGKFIEENSIKVPIIRDDTFVSYNVNLTEDEAQRIRIDPINRTGYIEIEEIQILGETGPVFTVNKEIGFFSLVLGNGVLDIESNGSKKILAIDNDPQMYINISSKSVTRRKINAIRINMRYLGNIPLDIVKKHNSAIRNYKRMEVYLKRIEHKLERILGSKAWIVTKPLHYLEQRFIKKL